MAIGLQYRDVLQVTPGVVEEFDNILPKIGSQLDKEHNLDGTHGDVTADSVLLQGQKMGEWVDLPFDTARFADNPNWSVSAANQFYLRFTRVGQCVTVQFFIGNSTIAVGTETVLTIALPELHAIPFITTNVPPNAGYQYGGSAFWSDTDGLGMALTQAYTTGLSGAVPQTQVRIIKFAPFASGADTNRAFQIGAGNVTVHGFCTFAVEPNNEPRPFYGA